MKSKTTTTLLTMKARLLLLGVIINLNVSANVAMSGVWWAGGTGNYAMLFPEDSIAYNKIQMKKEFVSIQLYKGYAVVKGEYWMYNTTKDTLKIKTGYPLNASGQYQNDVDEAGIVFDTLSQLEVFVDGQPASIIYKPSSNENNITTKVNDRTYSNWYIWVTKFKPEGYTKIEVYFIVNTNHTSISKGYGRESYNGFIYILESGATWKQPIEQGSIAVQLMDGMSINDVRGVQPLNIFLANEQNEILKYNFTNLSPTRKNNIIITYNDNLSNFNFEEAANNKQSLFQAVDKLSQSNFMQLSFKPKAFRGPLDISEGLNPMALIIIGFALGIGIILAIAIIIVLRVVRKRK
jgi:hypothetical protein